MVRRDGPPFGVVVGGGWYKSIEMEEVSYEFADGTPTRTDKKKMSRVLRPPPFKELSPISMNLGSLKRLAGGCCHAARQRYELRRQRDPVSGL